MASHSNRHWFRSLSYCPLRKYRRPRLLTEALTDLFLTPLKPPTKASISADAILSSLYYLHVSTSQDDDASEPMEGTNAEQDIEQKSGAPAVRRKPLPSDFKVSKAMADQQPRLMATSRGEHGQDPFSQLDFDTKSFPNQAEQSAPEPVHAPGTGPPQLPAARKLVGPRPLPQTGGSPGPRIPRKPVCETGFSLSGEGGPSGQAIPNTREAPNLDKRLVKETRIMIIRRDPSSASQWNIGSLVTKAFNGSFGGDDVKIEITTPGYQRFSRTSSYKSEDLKLELASLLNQRQDSDLNSKSNTSNLTAKLAEEARVPQHLDDDISTVFTRFLSFKNARPRSPKKHGRSRARTSSDPLRALDPNAGVPTLSKAAQLRHAAISFLSPWNGTCTFSTGIDGRSLKCRHTLPSGDLENGPASATAAELRFNLPWTTALVQKKDDLMLLRGGDQTSSNAHAYRPSLGAIFDRKADGKTTASLRNSFQRLKELSLNREPPEQAAWIPSSNFTTRGARSGSVGQTQPGPQQEEGLDLSLGREKAGGGMRGQSAKLGKLIIEDEGLKMCDLVVASCMAIWWMYYRHD